MKDIVVDTSTIIFLGNQSTPDFIKFFKWLRKEGALAVSTYLLKEYSGIGSSEIAALLETLKHSQPSRYNNIPKREIDTFNDRHFKYTCHMKDRCHVKLVMLSFRKLALSQEDNFINDVNEFPRHRALASKNPEHIPYE